MACRTPARALPSIALNVAQRYPSRRKSVLHVAKANNSSLLFVVFFAKEINMRQQQYKGHLLSSVILLTLTFAIFGLLLGFAESFDTPRLERDLALPVDIDARDPEIQGILFEECIKDAELDGELTEDEYYGCAYNIHD